MLRVAASTSARVANLRGRGPTAWAAGGDKHSAGDAGGYAVEREQCLAGGGVPDLDRRAAGPDDLLAVGARPLGTLLAVASRLPSGLNATLVTGLSGLSVSRSG